jgi:predicted transcriptional regulator
MLLRIRNRTGHKHMAYKDDTSYLGMRLDNELKARIERLADKEDRSVSKWVTRVLETAVEKAEAKQR